MRIASLLPSATEIVCAIGLGDELVGVTHECDFPPDVIGKPVITHSVHDLSAASSRDIHRLVTASIHGGSSLYALDVEALAAAEPDLILTQELCRVCAVGYEQVNEVARRLEGEVTVLSLEPVSIEGIFNAIFPEESLPPEWANYTAIDATWFTDKAAARAAVDELKPR